MQNFWKHADGELKIRRNFPYLGTADGFTTFLRKQFDGKYYAGVEIEINQHFLGKKSAHWKLVKTHLLEGFARLVKDEQSLD